MNVWALLDEHLPAFADPVLSVVDDEGWPVSCRCRVERDGDDGFLVSCAGIGSGPAVLLWHSHDDRFAATRALSVGGALDATGRPARFRVTRLVAAVNLPGREFSPDEFGRLAACAKAYLDERGLAPPELRWSDFDELAANS